MNQFIASSVLCLIALVGASELHAAAVGTPAPMFELVTFSGETYSNHMQNGRSLLLIFWAPWCDPCRIIGPIVEELAPSYQGRAVIAKMTYLIAF